MKTYNIPMSNDDIDLVILSVSSFTQKLFETMSTIRTDANIAEIKEYGIALRTQASLNKETFHQEKETFPKPTAVYAPFGLKKDGSASKRRGRPASKTKKVTA